MCICQLEIPLYACAPKIADHQVVTVIRGEHGEQNGTGAGLSWYIIRNNDHRMSFFYRKEIRATSVITQLTAQDLLGNTSIPGSR